MIDKRFFESFLRINNVSPNASAADIKTLLTQAHWSTEEIDDALRLHSSDGTETADQALIRKHREPVFRPDMDWSSSKLSSLLGMDVVIDPKSFHVSAEKKEQYVTLGRKIVIGLSITVIATMIAGSVGFGLMYFFEVGPFYQHVGEII